MLSTKYRLIKEKDFKRIKTKGQSFFSYCLKLGFIKNNLEYSRVAVVVSTHVSKKATDRNRIKRQIREVIRLNFDKIGSSFDIVFSVSGRAVGKKYEELEFEILKLLKKAKLI